jgi:ribosomal protein S18 acetylase RimI-like enzyme
MNIRSARIEDSPAAAELISETMEGFGDAVLGFGDRQRSIKAIGKFFAKTGNRFSHRSTFMAEFMNQTAGLLLAFPGKDLGKLTLPMAYQIWSIYSLREVLKLAALAPKAATGEEARPDEFYIAHLAVFPQFRQRGIGRALLAYADELGLKAGFTKCSLCVDVDNPAAQKLYLSSGYRIVKSIFTPKLESRLHTRGYHRMIKQIA